MTTGLGIVAGLPGRDVEHRLDLARFFTLLTAAQVHGRLTRGRGDRERPISLAGRPVYAADLPWLCYLVNEIFVEGTYAVGPLGPGATILDCGANIGISTLYFALTYPEATIVAFEPDPSAYSLLSRNTDSLANVETCNVALGAEDGDLTFFVDPSTTASPMMSAIKERQPKGHSLTVPCVRLSTRIAGPVALLKIDVEGMEWAILDDLIDSGTIARVERMAIEYHHHLPADRDDLSSFLRMLEEHSFGYEISATRRSGSPSDRYQDVMIYAFKKD